MMGFIITLHVIVCALLIGIILIQRGRGSGLVETFSGVESMFGTKTSSFLARTTTVLSVLFFITCLSLAFLSARQSRSLMRNLKAPAAEKNVPVPLGEPKVLPKEETKAIPAPPATQTPTSVVPAATTQSPEAPNAKPQEAPKTE